MYFGETVLAVFSSWWERKTSTQSCNFTPCSKDNCQKSHQWNLSVNGQNVWIPLLEFGFAIRVHSNVFSHNFSSLELAGRGKFGMLKL